MSHGRPRIYFTSEDKKQAVRTASMTAYRKKNNITEEQVRLKKERIEKNKKIKAIKLWFKQELEKDNLDTLLNVINTLNEQQKHNSNL